MAEPRRSAGIEAGDLEGARILIVEARFYEDIADALLRVRRAPWRTRASPSSV